MDETKQALKSYLAKNDLKNELKQSLKAKMILGKDSAAIEKEILEILRKNEIIDEILKGVSTKIVNPIIKNAEPPYLRLEVVRGRAFVDFLHETSSKSDSLTCFVDFERKRFRTEPKLCECEPKFNETFIYKLQTGNPEEILDRSRSVQITLVKTDCNGIKSLISTVKFDYVEVLSMEDGKAAVALKVHGIGHENKVPIGILDLRIEIVPNPEKKLSKEVVTTRLRLRNGKMVERERVFLQYARVWWKEYLEIRPSHEKRTVKIFAQDVNGVHRMVSWFVSPIYSDRFIDTTGNALRFVSLIPKDESTENVGGGSTIELWKTPLVLLESGNGGDEDHSILLCSLLLGFGLDAYVTIGKTVNLTTFSWVTTLSSRGKVTFWDAVNGNRYSLNVSHPFQTVDCLFNHQSFYANCQNSDLIVATSFDLSDQTLWKPMSVNYIETVSNRNQISVILNPGTLDPFTISKQLEKELKDLVTQYRKDLNLSANFNEELSRILGPGLAAYELELQTGQASSSDEFIDAVQHSVCDGHTFKGFPINTKHANGRRIFGESLSSEVFKDILSCRGDQLNFAIYVKVYVLPEDIVSVWTMFAVSYLAMS